MWHQVNLLEPGCASRLMREVKPTHLLHLAWVTTPGKYWNAIENLSWAQASLELMREFAKIGGRRAVCAGTCAEYDWRFGYCNEAVVPISPATLYGASKAGLWQILESFAHGCGLSLAWARIFFPYGPHEASERLLPSVINHLMHREPVRCTPGDQVRDFMYVYDVADALVALLESDVEGAVNVASGEPIAIRDLVTIVAERLNGLDLVQFGVLPIRDNDPPLLVADVRRLMNEVGWRPKHALHDGLRQTIEWWRTNFRPRSYELDTLDKPCKSGDASSK